MAKKCVFPKELFVAESDDKTFFICEREAADLADMENVGSPKRIAVYALVGVRELNVKVVVS